MADIELVIKIPEDEYQNILRTGKASFCAVNAIEAGTPLPKGHNGKNDVLDKIRAEIETKYGQCDICEYFEDYDYEENDISEYRPIGNIADILQIIDKYKTESEDNNADSN